MIINNKIGNISYCPYIKTEETIFTLLKRDKDMISDDYELMPYPLAHWINTMGIPKTNEILSILKSNKKRIFICQHIYVDRLNFEDSDIIFTPHGSINDRFITIPHYSVNIDESIISNKRNTLFSFLGSISTHITRKLIVNKYPENCFDSKVHWGLDKGVSEDFNTRYKKLLADSTFSICPRGTGISSVRLFESMAMGSIPVIIADGYEPPLNNEIDWTSISIFIKENDLDLNKLSEIPDEDVSLMREKLMEIYSEYFSNENLHKTILMKL